MARDMTWSWPVGGSFNAFDICIDPEVVYPEYFFLDIDALTYGGQVTGDNYSYAMLKIEDARGLELAHTHGAALGRLFAVAESYPDLKASENMLHFQEELSSTENKVAFARQAYNDSVMDYNTLRESFPNNFIAGWFAFRAAELLEIEDQAKREVPKVSF